MALLHIYDASDPSIIQTANKRGVLHRLPVEDGNKFYSQLDDLVLSNLCFDRVLFETHGSPGRIHFGQTCITADWWRSVLHRNYTSLTTVDVRVYFNGCNVAKDAVGWDFLQAAAAVFLKPGGGEVFGQTSGGSVNPFNGHVVHLWGTTRRLFVNRDGKVLEYFEQ